MRPILAITLLLALSIAARESAVESTFKNLYERPRHTDIVDESTFLARSQAAWRSTVDDHYTDLRDAQRDAIALLQRIIAAREAERPSGASHLVNRALALFERNPVPPDFSMRLYDLMHFYRHTDAILALPEMNTSDELLNAFTALYQGRHDEKKWARYTDLLKTKDIESGCCFLALIPRKYALDGLALAQEFAGISDGAASEALSDSIDFLKAAPK